jgi:hypothetical protein
MTLEQFKRVIHVWNEHVSFIIHNKYPDNTSSTFLQRQFSDDKQCSGIWYVITNIQNRETLAR